MKDIFRRLKRQDLRFNKQLEGAHDVFFKKILKHKKEMLGLEDASVGRGKGDLAGSNTKRRAEKRS